MVTWFRNTFRHFSVVVVVVVVRRPSSSSSSVVVRRRRRSSSSVVRRRRMLVEGTLTLPLPALRALGPLRAYSFLALIFCIIFRDVFCIVCSCICNRFRPPFWHHVGVIFNVFCIIVSSIDSTWIVHQFCKDFYVFFVIFLLISMVLHPIGESLKNNSFYITFA